MANPLLPAERPVLKLLLFAFLVRRPVGATLCADYRQIWQGGCGRNILVSAKFENFPGSFGEFRFRKPEKQRNNLENARNNYIFATM